MTSFTKLDLCQLFPLSTVVCSSSVLCGDRCPHSVFSMLILAFLYKKLDQKKSYQHLSMHLFLASDFFLRNSWSISLEKVED